jgi:hypothetical protein
MGGLNITKDEDDVERNLFLIEMNKPLDMPLRYLTGIKHKLYVNEYNKEHQRRN